LNQQIAAMRRQLAALEEALAASENRDRESQARIADLGSRLNVALAQRVQELARYRSDFFGRLRQILGSRPDVRIVGDRFVFQSEVLFPAGQANLRPEAGGELDRIASAVVELSKQIPPDISWVHAGGRARRISGRSRPRSSLELGPLRGAGECGRAGPRGPRRSPDAPCCHRGSAKFQPLEAGTTDEAFARNRASS
jgi:chemotaxis protein MotB